ncbi:MAG: LytR family transcriptional regulator [Anaerolineae bacterium]|nr:MAG: LytR family transcriptional regulator [Anaerolineae bacterium]
MPSRLRNILYSNSLLWGLGAAFLVAVLATAVLTFIVVRDAVVSWWQAPRVEAAIHTPTPLPNVPTLAPNQVLQTNQLAPTPQPWDGQSRINILLLGLDYRDWEAGQGPPRSDSMILLSIDPPSKTAGMLSIPRDLWVNLPNGFGYGKINTAYMLGEAYQLDGGGPGMAMQAVSNLLGMPVDYYARVDFDTFVRFVDEIGGVKINVPETITVDLLGDGTQKTLQPGVQTLSGEIALAYARARHTAGGDFDRARRQQQVLLAVRDRILDFNLLPDLMQRAPYIYYQAQEGIDTNLTFDYAIKLAWLMLDIPPENIHHGIIGPEQVDISTSYDGQSILVYDPQALLELRDDIFSTYGRIEPAAAGTPDAALLRAEAARIFVQNGTSVTGLGARTRDYLEQQGFDIAGVGNADQLYPYTTVIDYTGNPYTLKSLIASMGIADSQIFTSYDPAATYDVILIVGDDWAQQNP